MNTNNTNSQESDALKEVVHYIRTNPLVVHGRFFAHRHPQASAPFHKQMLLDWYSTEPQLQHIVFRGGAKSTTGEEAVTIIACTAMAMNIPIIGSSSARAKERLAAVKHEIETNDYLLKTFGDLRGSVWAETKIVLKNNVCIQALGWNESMRGIKHLEWRPELGWIDDIEDEENTASPEAREKVVKRLTAVVIPAIDAPGRRLRITGTPLDPESLVEKLSKSPAWVTRRFPIKHRHPETGEWQPSWPERKPLPLIDQLEEDYRALGMIHTFNQEYMCMPIAEEQRRFKEEHMRAEPVPRTYQATYAVYDPARTTNELSAHTGKVVFSWHLNRLIIWESSGNFWKPDEITSDIFDTDSIYNPIQIGVEENGLHEFIMQPIRQEAMRRGHPVPIKPLRAPKGKLNFIQGLQPFFLAKEVILVPTKESHSVLVSQLLSFPSGRIDIPNALAYALHMRPGAPMFDNFQDVHVDPNPLFSKSDPYFLALNTTGVHTTAVLVQLSRGQYRILQDWIYEGDIGTVIQDIYQAASLLTMRPIKFICPPKHFSNYDTLGLRAAARLQQITVHKGGDLKVGLETVRQQLSSTNHGYPSLVVSPNATWTLRAFAGGYARKLDKTGFLKDEPELGPYCTLMEGLQAMFAFPNVAVDDEANYAVTSSGHRYKSARPT